MKLRLNSPLPGWGRELQGTLDRRLPPPLRGRSGPILDVIVVLVALLLPRYLDAGAMQTAVNVGLYVLLALGLNVVVGFAGLLDLGYIAFYAIGAYLYAFLASPQFGLHWPFLVILPIAAIVAAIFGVSFGAPTLRLRGDYLAIVTLGFGEIIQIVANNAMALTNGPQGVSALDYPNIFGYQFDVNSTPQYYYLLAALCAIVIFCVSRLQASRIGRAWAAIREDEDAARAVGIDTVRMKLLAFAIGAMIGGLAGPVFAASQSYISPVSFSLDQSILVLAMVVLGGMGSIRGVIVGATILVVVPEYLREYAAARFIVVGMIMVVLMIVRPGGLLPSRARSSEMRAAGRAAGMSTSDEKDTAEGASARISEERAGVATGRDS